MAQIGMDSQAFLLILDEFLKVVKDKIALLKSGSNNNQMTRWIYKIS